MTIQKRLMYVLMLVSILVAPVSAISAQEHELNIILCVLENNSLMLTFRANEHCRQYVSVDVPFTSSREMFQFLRAIQEDVYNALLEQGLITPDRHVIGGNIVGNPLLPSVMAD